MLNHLLNQEVPKIFFQKLIIPLGDSDNLVNTKIKKFNSDIRKKPPVIPHDPFSLLRQAGKHLNIFGYG